MYQCEQAPVSSCHHEKETNTKFFKNTKYFEVFTLEYSLVRATCPLSELIANNDLTVSAELPDQDISSLNGFTAVFRFDEIFTGKYLPLKSGYRLTGAYLGLEFDKIGSDLDMLVNRTSWDSSSTTWNSFGTAGDGVNPEEDAEPIRPVALYGNQILLLHYHYYQLLLDGRNNFH